MRDMTRRLARSVVLCSYDPEILSLRCNDCMEPIAGLPGREQGALVASWEWDPGHPVGMRLADGIRVYNQEDGEATLMQVLDEVFHHREQRHHD